MAATKILLLVAVGGFFAANLAFGQTWTQTSAPSNEWHSVALSADGVNWAAVGGEFVPVYISTNSGATWIATTPPWPTNKPPISFFGTSVACSPDGIKLILAVPNNGIYLSTNLGAAWTQANLPVTNWFTVASSADGSNLAAAAGGNNLYGSSVAGLIYASTNSGATWTQTSAPSEVWGGIASSADGTRLIAAGYSDSLGNVGPIYISTNSENCWAQTDAPSNYWTSVASSADGSKLMAAAGYRWPIICISTNWGITWVSNNPYGSWQSVAMSADGSKLAAICQNGLIYISTNLGTTWTSNGIPASPCSAVASSADGNKLVVSVDFFSVGGTSGGIWTLQTTPSPALHLTPSKGDLALSWIVPSTNFVLQQSCDLCSWTDLTNAPVLNLTNLQDEVALPLTNGNSFYRL